MLKIYLDNCCDNFYYTEWRENLWEDLTLDELFERAKKVKTKYETPDNID